MTSVKALKNGMTIVKFEIIDKLFLKLIEFLDHGIVIVDDMRWASATCEHCGMLFEHCPCLAPDYFDSPGYYHGFNDGGR